MDSAFSTSLFDHLWVPASRAVPRSQQKVMVVLHGRGDSFKSFRDIKSEMKLPHMNYLVINAPRRYQGGYSWYAQEPHHERGVKQARSRLFDLVSELNAAGWPSKSIFWMGHSQGCLVCCDLVLNHPDVFGGLVGVSGYVWFFRGWRNVASRSGAKKTPWLITHGKRDRIILPKEIREDVDELVRGKVPVLYQEFLKGHDFDFRNEVPFIRRWIREPRQRIQSCAR